MAQTIHRRSPADGDSHDEPESAPDAEGVLALLDDPYAWAILDALRDGRKPARELVDECGCTRPTVYRRLDRLEAAGLVESEIAIHRDGHHRQEFSVRADRITLRLDESGLTVSVSTDQPDH